MPEPFALLSLALASSGGRLDGVEAQQWVASGHALLMRAASLVRMLERGRSALLLPPSGAFVAALAASDGRGAVLVNPLASRSEILWQLRDAAVTAVFTNSALVDRVPADITRVLLDDVPRSATVLSDGISRTIDLGSHFGLALEGRVGVEGSDEEAVIVYTSAMAGTPLGAILSHKNLLFNARASASAMASSAEDNCLVALPFSHLFGLVVATASPLMQGARVQTMERFHPGRALETIEAANITQFMGVPSMFKSMLHVIARRPRAEFRTHTLRLCFSGGAVVTQQLQDRWYDATGVELLQGYGLTEAGPAALLTRSDGVNRRGAMGIPLDGTRVSVRDSISGLELAIECEGELCVRGPHVFRGYVRNGVHGLQVRDNWLYTGDLATKHTDGTFSFRGLRKPMFTRNGFNIYPKEIEAALSRMPGVLTANVWAIEDDTKENNIAVRVFGDVSESAVRQWAQSELATYKHPTQVEVVSG